MSLAQRSGPRGLVWPQSPRSGCRAVSSDRGMGHAERLRAGAGFRGRVRPAPGDAASSLLPGWRPASPLPSHPLRSGHHACSPCSSDTGRSRGLGRPGTLTSSSGGTGCTEVSPRHEQDCRQRCRGRARTPSKPRGQRRPGIPLVIYTLPSDSRGQGEVSC